jgi:adenylylsulfate kinase-like enzyme
MARELERYIFDSGGICVLLSGGTLRSGISGELEFDAPDRAEHLRRAAETARLLNDHGIICVCSFISPDAEIRSQLAGIVGERRFFEVFVDASLDFCRKRDKSGLYERAEKGDVDNVAGIDFPYEPPTAPALHVEMDGTTIEQAVADIAAFMRGRRILPEKPA